MSCSWEGLGCFSRRVNSIFKPCGQRLATSRVSVAICVSMVVVGAKGYFYPGERGSTCPLH